jgi:hypothetical protein
LAARADVLDLELRRRRLLARLPVAPGLGLAQVAAAEEKAGVAPTPIPLARAQPDPRVAPHPVRVDAHRLQELRRRLVEPLVGGEVDPLRMSECLRHGPLRRSSLHRSDPLAAVGGVLELQPAVRRGERVGTEHEDERVGGVDRAAKLGLVVGRPVGDVLPVDVDLLVAFDQGRVKPLDERAVAP